MTRRLVGVALLSLVMTSAAVASDGWLMRSQDSGASTYTGSRADDPIVFPGKPRATHMHDFFCNKAITARSTYKQMVVAATSSPSGDTAGYWAPALYKNGVKINPAGRGTRQQIYYRDNNLSSGTKITPFPRGFKMVVGDQRATSLGDANAINRASGIGSKIGSEIYWGALRQQLLGKVASARQLRYGDHHAPHRIPELLERGQGGTRSGCGGDDAVPEVRGLPARVPDRATEDHRALRVPGRHQLQRDHAGIGADIHSPRRLLEHLAAERARKARRPLPQPWRRLRHEPLGPMKRGRANGTASRESSLTQLPRR
jgi:Domain of unknown function (DUF1996)